MAIKIGSNFAYNGKLPNFERDSFKTKAAMKAFDENSIDEGHLSYCKEDGNIYQYKHTNTVDAATGKWRLFKTDADAVLNGTSTNAIQNKAVFEALKLKADVVALDKYQPKYNVDYVAKADFDYSELPNGVDSIVDLNGYTMSVSADKTIVRGEYYNGRIDTDSNQVELSGVYCNNVSILSSAEGVDQCKIGEACTFQNCRLTNILLTADCEFHNCDISNSVIDCFLFIEFSVIFNCTFSGSLDSLSKIKNSIIDNVTYNIAVIENGKPIETGYESNIASPSVSGNAPSCEAVKDALQLKADKTQLNDLATKTELNGKADKTQLNNYVTTATANTTYAKKSDITNIYKFKGTKTNYADLPTTNRVTGDVWNITNADAEHGIKAGDNVAWNGTAWDNLSGTVDLSAYATTSTTDAMSADIKKLMDKAFPFTVKVSIDKTLAKKGTSQHVTITINAKKGDDVTSVDEININGTKYTGEIPYTHSATATTTTTYNVTVKKGSQTASKSVEITFVNPSYDGAVAANFTVTEANIKALTETLRSGKGGTRTFNLNNQKACIAYPKSFGAATGIKDANGFDYLASYTRSELNVNGEPYYVYLLTNAATITDMKQTIS